MKILPLLALIISGCIVGEVVEPQTCSTRSVSFPATSINSATQYPAPSNIRSFTIPTIIGKDWISNVIVTSGELTLDNDASFSFVDDLIVSVASHDGSDLVLRDVLYPDTNTKLLTIGAIDKNLIDYVSSDNNLTINLTISTNQSATTDWNVNAVICLSTRVSGEYKL